VKGDMNANARKGKKRKNKKRKKSKGQNKEEKMANKLQQRTDKTEIKEEEKKTDQDGGPLQRGYNNPE
jgi:hypothetical protein